MKDLKRFYTSSLTDKAHYAVVRTLVEGVTKATQAIIVGWRRCFDALSFGATSGLSCISICWAPMTALTMAHHNFILMAMVSLITICDRYWLSHRSRHTGYFWLTLALVIVIIN
jgi:predicted metal-binding membrane protein